MLLIKLLSAYTFTDLLIYYIYQYTNIYTFYCKKIFKKTQIHVRVLYNILEVFSNEIYNATVYTSFVITAYLYTCMQEYYNKLLINKKT